MSGSLIIGRMYAIDADRDNGQLFYFPYRYGCNPSRLPGYVLDHKPGGPFAIYVNELRQLCSNKLKKRMITAVFSNGELT